jgi:hypothetical protein
MKTISVKKPLSILNVGESGIQLINKPGNVLAKKGVRGMHVPTPRATGENVTVITRWNAEILHGPQVLVY